MRPNTSRGLRARQTSGPSPSRSITPGRKPSSRASAFSTRASTVSTASGFFRSRARLRRPRWRTSHAGRSGGAAGTACARSTRMTSAPMSASIMAAKGPGPMPANSMMRTPCSGPAIVPAVQSTPATMADSSPARPPPPVAVAVAGEAEDGAGQQRPQRHRQVMTHVGHHEQAGARDELGGALAAAGGDQGVVETVDDQGRRGDGREGVGPRAGRVDGGELPRRALRVEAAVVAAAVASPGPAPGRTTGATTTPRSRRPRRRRRRGRAAAGSRARSWPRASPGRTPARRSST